MLIWSVDTMAMIGGKILQGPKLAPSISPNKTISGLLTGVISAVIIVIIIWQKNNLLINNIYNVCLYTMLLAVMAQVSDLLVSFFKRKFKVKDSGNIIPGHGGVLDRFDSIILTAPIIFLYYK
jgi:phosphatidate cytidylyltransferase